MVQMDEMISYMTHSSCIISPRPRNDLEQDPKKEVPCLMFVVQVLFVKCNTIGSNIIYHVVEM